MNAFVIHTLPILLLGLLAKSVCLLLAAWVVCLVLRRASAATRHLVWSSALGGLLLLPLLTLAMPHWNLILRRGPTTVSRPTPPVPAVVTSPPLPAPITDPGLQPPVTIPAVQPAVRPLPIPQPPRPFHVSIHWPFMWSVTGLGVWCLGGIAILVRLVAGLRRVETIKRRTFPLDEATHLLADSLRQRIGLRRHVTFLRAGPGSGVFLPLTWGGRRPTVLLPEQSDTWPETTCRAALLHELAHVSRWDWTTQTVCRLTCALYWVNPLAWLAARAARAESERACDDCVLAAGLSAADYAQRLVDVVRSLPDGPPVRTAAIAMAQPSEIESRLRSLLAKGRNRAPITRKLAWGMVAALALCVLPLAAIRLTAQAQTTLTASDDVQPVPGGGTIQLVGISEYPSAPGTWWGKDGVRLPGTPAVANASVTMSKLEKNQQAREFVLETRGTNMDDDYEVDVPSGLSENTNVQPAPGGVRIFYVGYFPKDQQTAAVRVGVATQPWKALARAWPQTESTAFTGNTRSTDLVKPYTASFSPPSTVRGQLAFTISDTVTDHPTRVVAIDTKGQIVEGGWAGDSSIGALHQRTVTFPTLALQNIKELQLQWRSYDWIEFKNVPLQPATTAADAPPAPAAALPLYAINAAQIAPDGRSVHLAGVSTYPASQTWWDKDGIRLPKAPDSWRAPSQSGVAMPDGQKARTFLVSINRTRPDDTLRLDPMAVLMDPPSRNIINSDFHPLPGRNGGFVYGLMCALPAAQKTGTFRIGIASQPWSVLQTQSLAGQGQETLFNGTSEELGNYAARLSPPSIVGGVLTFTWTYTVTPQPTHFHTFRFAAIDTQGHRIFAGSRHGKLVAGLWQHTIVFPRLAPKDIKQIQFQMRSYDWFEFKNIPLQPVGASAAFGLPKPKPVLVGFRRYVSRPTPEGLRYTFLYPAYLTKLSVSAPDTKSLTFEEMDLQAGAQPVRWTPDSSTVAATTYPDQGTSVGTPPVPLEDVLSVEVGQKYSVPWSGRTAPRRDRQWAGAGRSHHDIALTDPRTQRRFWLNHDDYNAPPLFRLTDPVIAKSFQILPPDAPVPSRTQR